jgi:archaellum biogenesis ATPase FlaH
MVFKYDYGRQKEIKSIIQLEEFIKNLPANKIILFLIDPSSYMKRNLDTLKIVVNQNKFSGIYITVNRPFDTLIKIMKEDDINTEKIFFIDCITKMSPESSLFSLSSKSKLEKTENCIFIPSPSRLTEIGLALSEALTGIENPKNKFLYLDSLSTLLIYNELDTIVKFVHFLTTRIRLFGIVGIIMCVEKRIEEKLLNILSEICDIIVEVVE